MNEIQRLLSLLLTRVTELFAANQNQYVVINDSLVAMSTQIEQLNDGTGKGRTFTKKDAQDLIVQRLDAVDAKLDAIQALFDKNINNKRNNMLSL